MSALKNNFSLAFLIGLIAALIFIPFIGACPLFDWDEVNFAECAREMLVTANNRTVQLNYQPFWEKPPLFIWLQAFCMNIFGVNEFAARLPNAVCGIASCVSMFYAGLHFHSRRFGITWCLIYAASLLPHFYFKSGIIDPWFNLFIFLSAFHAIRFLNNPSGKKEILNSIFSGLFLGLAVLTKGPAALVIMGLTLIFWMGWNKDFGVLRSKNFILFFITTILISCSWFLLEWLSGNKKVVLEFIRYQIRLFNTGDSGHDGSFFYHFIVLLIGCFPTSILFLISYFKYSQLSPYQRQFRKLFLCLFWVVLILFSVVKTKIVHYSSLCYYPLTFMATIGVVNYFEDLKFNSVSRFLFILCSALLSAVFLAMSLINVLKDGLIKSGLISDRFAILSLQAHVHWSGFESLILIFMMGSCVLIYRAIKKHHYFMLYSGLSAQVIFIFLAILIYIPKVEQYTQHAAIEFYKANANSDCYIETHGFKSYAQLFYSNRKPGDYENKNQKEYIKNQLNVMEKEGHSRFSSYSTANLFWMEVGDIDRPAYVVVKTPQEDEVNNRKEFQKLYEKNGYTFLVRLPKKK